MHSGNSFLLSIFCFVIFSVYEQGKTKNETEREKGALNTRGVGKLAIFVRFSNYIAVYLGNGAR